MHAEGFAGGPGAVEPTAVAMQAGFVPNTETATDPVPAVFVPAMVTDVAVALIA